MIHDLKYCRVIIKFKLIMKDRDYFSKLPDEMVIKILLQLDYDSVRSARVCCVRFEIILTGIFEEMSQFKFDRLKSVQLARDNPVHNWVFKTNKKFKNLCFTDFNFDDAKNSDIDEFWNLHGENVINLHMNYCSANEITLHKILDKTKNLKHFKLGLSRTIDGAKIINKLLDRCVEITFTTATYIDRKGIETISTDREIAVEELNLAYMRCSGRFDNTTIFRDTGIYKLLKLIKSKLKRFELFATNENILHQLIELKLNLETFKIYFNDQIDNGSMLAVTQEMKNLQKLNISGPLFSDENANVIYDNLHDLRSLTFLNCDLLSNNGIANVTKLKKLEEFNINCQNVTNRGIVNGIAHQENRTLKHLKLFEHFSNDTLIAIVNNLTNLDTLYINTTLFISPHLIPLIYERLTNLKELSIIASNEPKDTDTIDEHDEPNSLPEPKLNNSNVRISQLNKLLVLYISGYKIIPGVSLYDIAEIPKLRYLTLHAYEEITNHGLIHLLTTLKCLRKVDLRYCNSVFVENDMDTAVIEATQKLKIDLQFNSKTLYK